VSQREISFNGWNGVGYTVIDPVTGAGGYIISGGLAGGALLKLLIGIMAWLLSPSEASAATGAEQENQMDKGLKGFLCGIIGVPSALLSIIFLISGLHRISAAILGFVTLSVSHVIVLIIGAIILTTFLLAISDACLPKSGRLRKGRPILLATG